MPLYNSARDEHRIAFSEDEAKEQSAIEFRDRYHEDVSRLVHSPSYRRLARKRQLLPNEHSDFVRNRLTHSCEVAQIASSIGAWLNKSQALRDKGARIRPDILVFAGLAHDLGHPPFGHLGERTLNERMWDAGGFEGNAQTLRILAHLEKRLTKASRSQSKDGESLLSFGNISGLNLTARSIASIIKYDFAIPVLSPDTLPERRQPELIKGYYKEEEDLVRDVKLRLGFEPEVFLDGAGVRRETRFKTIEAQIMDIADDIAYSIYDLEDCLKSGVLSPLDLLNAPRELLEKIGSEMAYKLTVDYFRRAMRTDSLDSFTPTMYPEDSFEDSEEFKSRKEDYQRRLSPSFLSRTVFRLFFGSTVLAKSSSVNESVFGALERLSELVDICEAIQSNELVRRRFTEQFIGSCVRSCKFIYNEERPRQSTISISRPVYLQIEFLKRFNFHTVIQSDLIQSADRRHSEMIKRVFDGLYLPGDEYKRAPRDVNGFSLFPEKVRAKLFKIFAESAFDYDMFFDEFDAQVRSSSMANPMIPLQYPLEYMLRFSDFNFRFELSEALHRAARTVSPDTHAEYMKAQRRRLLIKRLVCDLIANMTDRGLEEFHHHMVNSDPRLIFDDHSI